MAAKSTEERFRDEVAGFGTTPELRQSSEEERNRSRVGGFRSYVAKTRKGKEVSAIKTAGGSKRDAIARAAHTRTDGAKKAQVPECVPWPAHDSMFPPTPPEHPRGTGKTARHAAGGSGLPLSSSSSLKARMDGGRKKLSNDEWKGRIGSTRTREDTARFGATVESAGTIAAEDLSRNRDILPTTMDPERMKMGRESSEVSLRRGDPPDVRVSYPGAYAIEGINIVTPTRSGPDSIEFIVGYVPNDDRGAEGDVNGMNRRDVSHLVATDAPLVEGKAVRPMVERKSQCNWKKPALLAGVILLVGTIASIISGVIISNGATSSNGKESQDAGKIINSARFEAVVSVLVSRGVTEDSVLADIRSPQHRAAKWLADEDQLLVDLSDTSSIVQRYRLSTLLYSTGGDKSWTELFGFLTPTHECGWNDRNVTGAFCVYEPDVVSNISLPENNLVGYIPREIWSMSSLRRLSMPYNSLQGSIPAVVSDLADIVHIDLDSNGLTGSLPTALGELSQLQWLALDANSLSGVIPTSINRLQSSLNISIAANNLIGTIPFGWSLLSSLRWLYFGHNNLTGTLPPDLPDSLRILDLPDNSLRGPIPRQLLANKTFLKWLDLGRNLLTSTIPLEVVELTNLFKLRLNDNNLVGPIPKNISNLKALEWVDLSMNELTGSVHSEIGDLSKLKFLFLNDNMLNGTISNSLGSLHSLEALHLENNDLSGSIDFLCQSSRNITPENLDYVADCLGQDPEIVCSCCSICCSQDGVCRVPS